MTLVLAFAGKIGSGKTALSGAVSEALGWRRASFGDYVRHVVSGRGLMETRENLQRIGTELLEADMFEFCRRVLTHSGWSNGEPLIIDGLRHAETAPLISQIVEPAEMRIIYIDIDQQSRLNRLTRRGEGDPLLLTLAEQHSSELQVGSILRGMADLILDGRRPIPESTASVLQWVKKQ